MTGRSVCADARWAENRREPPGLLIGLTTFGILALELALIRWTSSQVRVFAYFNNLVLIGAFLGMGLGVALGRRWPGLVHFALPVLLVVALPLAFSERLGLVHLAFPDQTIALWGGGWMAGDFAVFFRSLAIFLALFVGIVAVFACGGAPLGWLFARMPVLRAYTADLWGSLIGIGAFAAAAWLDAGPAVWLALGAAPFAWVARSYLAAALAALVVLLGQLSVRGALFSPYNRIDVQQESPAFLSLAVNRDFHQYLHDLSDARLRDPRLGPEDRATLQNLRELYDLPFVINAHRNSAVVVGAGTGNDVQAALRNGYRRVTSVDIDGRIIGLGRALHPEKPYARAEVETIVDDARAFFGRSDGKFDVVCFGLLDSHAMFSAMTTLRLDNYVYTEEGIRAAWSHVADGGHLSLAVSCVAGRWFFERLYWTVERATGKRPLAFYNPVHGATVTFIVPRDGATFDGAELAKRTATLPETPRDKTLTPSDDWPFLYVRPGVFPWGYVAVLGFVLVLAAALVPPVFGLRRGGGFDLPLFLMGAAFLLIETRGVTSMSLLFGSTWIVNAAIFAGIVFMVLVANLVVRRWELKRPAPWFLGLFAAVALLYFFPIAWLQTLPLGARALLSGLLTGLPVGFAGLIVPMLLADAKQPSAALGSNLLGAVLGGCLEYYSMLGGLRSTALMALALYLVAYAVLARRRAAAVSQGAIQAPA
jgi:hypothetical protein